MVEDTSQDEGEYLSNKAAVAVSIDGGCRGNPGPGAWAVVLEEGSERREFSGFSEATTNQCMELRAAAEALGAVLASRGPCAVTVYTDSAYLCDGMTRRWYASWERNGYKTKQGKPVKNADLWKSIVASSRKLESVSWVKVRGHSGHPGNERADKLVNAEMDRHGVPSSNGGNGSGGSGKRKSTRKPRYGRGATGRPRGGAGPRR